MNELRDETGPARLVARTEPCAVVAVEVFVEEDVVAPVRIGLELLRAPIYGSPACHIAREYPGEPCGDFPAHLEKVHLLTRARGTLDGEVVAVIEIETQ